MGLQSPWYKGARGEWYVVAQIVLMALVFFGPRGGEMWRFPRSMFGTAGGLLLMWAGLILAASGIISLGSNRTAAPRPKEDATLIQTGAYRFVRHPMYSGGILFALGFALLVHDRLTLGYVLLLIIFLDIKSRREERWLVEKFPGYTAYQKRVRKLIPFTY